MAAAAKLLNKIMDNVDGVLYANGLEFRDDCDWSVAGEEIAAWVYKYYDDLVDDDEEFDPAKPVDDEAVEQDALSESSVSATLSSSDAECDAGKKRLRDSYSDNELGDLDGHN